MEVDAAKGKGKDSKGKGKSKGKDGKGKDSDKGKDKDKDNKQCTHCGKKGHLAHQCWAKAKGKGKTNVVDKAATPEAAAAAASSRGSAPTAAGSGTIMHTVKEKVRCDWIFAVARRSAST